MPLFRGGPCSCGSGRPASSCCGRFRRVTERQAASAFVVRQARVAWEVVSPFSPAALAALQVEAASLPARCDAFASALLVAREPVGGDVRRVGRALRRPTLGAVLRRADTPMARAAVAKALAEVRESGEADEYVAAAGLFDLAGVQSGVTEAALLQAGAVVVGRAVSVSESDGASVARPVIA